MHLIDENFLSIFQFYHKWGFEAKCTNVLHREDKKWIPSFLFLWINPNQTEVVLYTDQRLSSLMSAKS